MQKISVLFFSVLCLFASFTQAQSTAPIYKLIIKGGRVIDTKNNINELMDVAIQDGKIAKVAKNIDTTLGAEIVNAKGMYVTPGLIDLHTHVYVGTEPGEGHMSSSTSVFPDGFTFRNGVTTVVDAGCSGWKTFDKFKTDVIDRAETRVLVFLNIVGEGMRGRPTWEQDVNDMDPKKTAEKALANKDIIVGFKHAHYFKADWTPVQRVVEAGNLAKLPVIIDLGGSVLPDGTVVRIPLNDLFFKLLRPGDIYTHVFTERPSRDPVVDLKTRQLKSYIIPAQKRGIIFDVGYGGGSFDFRQAIPAFKAGFYPNTMGTDTHTGSEIRDELYILSIFMAMGMDIPSVIARSTWAPAQAIKREELGNLSEGGIADVAILSVREGKFGFSDTGNGKLEGTKKLECEMTIKGGKIMYDLNAISSSSVLYSVKK